MQERTSNNNSQRGDSSPAAQNDGLHILEVGIDAGAGAGRLVYGQRYTGRDARAEMMMQAMGEFGVSGSAATSVVAVQV